MHMNDLEDIANLFKVMGHVARLKIVTVLANGEYSVGELEKQSDIQQPTLSQQLAILRNADLVTTRREAKQVHYSLNQNRIGEICDALGWMHKDHGPVSDEITALDRHRKLGSASSFARII